MVSRTRITSTQMRRGRYPAMMKTTGSYPEGKNSSIFPLN